MGILKEANFKWAALNEALNQIIGEVNRNRPVGKPGAAQSVFTEETPQGTMLSITLPPVDSTTAPAGTTDAAATPWKNTPDGSLGGWAQYNVCENGVVVPKWFWTNV